MFWVALHLPGLAAETLEPLAAWACQFTPRVGLEPDALLLEVEGSLRYFRGPDALLGALECGLAELGVRACLATAETACAALWRARGGGLPLPELPVSVIGGDHARFFKSIGIFTVGELLALPREGLAQRCGQGLIDELDRALGRLPDPRQFFAPPERFAARLELPAEVSHAEALLFGARRLLVQLEGLLAARQCGVRAFVLALAHLDGSTSEVNVQLASTARDADRLAQLLREKLAVLKLAQPVEAISLSAADFLPFAGRSALFGDRAAEAEDWAQLLERLQARLGRDAVHGISAYPDHRPEYAWRRVEPGEWDPHEFMQPGPRPAWLLERVLPVEESRLALVAGPERIDCGWWDGDEARRDYFVAQLGRALAWVYREEGQWYVHGFFA
ncbi:MAG TPA: DNA polymerase Y family protein [Burkholderiales bacterium]|nr:DNA polymerase Y family protein [Burkholderiales bacterium]